MVIPSSRFWFSGTFEDPVNCSNLLSYEIISTVSFQDFPLITASTSYFCSHVPSFGIYGGCSLNACCGISQLTYDKVPFIASATNASGVSFSKYVTPWQYNGFLLNMGRYHIVTEIPLVPWLCVDEVLKHIFYPKHELSHGPNEWYIMGSSK